MRERIEYTQGLTDYIMDKLENSYLTDEELIKDVQDLFGITLNEKKLNIIFRRSRADFLPKDKECVKAWEIIDAYKKRVKAIKKDAIPGKVLIYLDEVPGDYTKPKIGKRYSVIKGIYPYFILTYDGAIQFNDIRGVI